MGLNPEQLRHYREHGYACGGRLLDDDALAQLRTEIDRLIAGLAPGCRPENMASIHYDNPYFEELLLSAPLVDVAEQLLGPDVALFTSYAIAKRSGDGLAVAWHQDAAFFPIDPMATFTLWLAVDDADPENGCMQVIPDSHRERRVWPHKVDRASSTVLPLSLDRLDLQCPVDVPVKAGCFSVHDPFILHGSNPNRSRRRRCGITVKYVPNWVKLDRNFVSPTGFDWHGLRLYWARGKPGTEHRFYNVPR